MFKLSAASVGSPLGVTGSPDGEAARGGGGESPPYSEGAGISRTVGRSSEGVGRKGRKKARGESLGDKKSHIDILTELCYNETP